MVVNAVAGHAQIKTVKAVQRVLVFLELIRRDHDVVTTQQVQANGFVVSDEAVVDSRIFVAIVKQNSVATIFGNGHTLNENFLNLDSVDAMAALWIPGDTQVADHDSPEPVVFFDRVSGGMLKNDRRFPFLVAINDVSRRSGTGQQYIAAGHDQWFGDFELSGGETYNPASSRNGVEGRLQVRK